MTFQQLQYFVSVAEFLSFTKAAKRHYLAQPAISQQISALEKELGIDLFIRNTHSVALTEAGKIFYRTALQTIKQLEYGISSALNVQLRNLQNSLTLGFMGAPENSFLSRAIKLFIQNCPNTNLELLHESTSFALKIALLEHNCDACFMFTSDIYDGDSINHIPIIEYPMCAFIARDHPLASQTKIPANELSSLVNIRPSADYNGVPASGLPGDSVYDSVHRGIMIADSLESTMMLIEAGVGCGFFPGYVKSLCSDRISCIELYNDDDITDNKGHELVRNTEISFAWLKSTENSSVSFFLSVLNEVVMK